MGTPKRERQKANRLQRQIEQERAQRVGTMRRTVLRFTLIAVLAIIGVVVIAWLGGAFSGDDDDEGGDADPIDLPADEATDEAPAIDKPEVELPAALPDDLVITTLSEGTGPEAADGDVVSVYYVGVRSEDGVEFDTNYGGTPFDLVLGSGSVIQGWEQGLLGAQEGGRYQLDIPADLAYGDSARGDVIRAGDALTFVIDVVSVTQG